MAVLFLKLFPTLLESRTIVIKADENQLGAPAQPVTNVIWRGVTAGELFVTVRAIMFLPGYFIAALIHKHFEATSGNTLRISKLIGAQRIIYLGNRSRTLGWI
jgi:hypothetical protein